MVASALPPSRGREPALPADLPPTEAKRSEVMVLAGTPSPHPPQSAPGFTRAWELGLLPAPAPTEPPAPVPGVRAQVLLWSGIAPSPYFPGLLQRWEGPGWAMLPQH